MSYTRSGGTSFGHLVLPHVLIWLLASAAQHTALVFVGSFVVAQQPRLRLRSEPIIGQHTPQYVPRPHSSATKNKHLMT